MEAIVAMGSVTGELLGGPSPRLRANLADGPVALFTPFLSMWPPLAGRTRQLRAQMQEPAVTHGSTPGLKMATSAPSGRLIVTRAATADATQRANSGSTGDSQSSRP